MALSEPALGIVPKVCLANSPANIFINWTGAPSPFLQSQLWSSWRVWLECTGLRGGAGLHLSYWPPLFPLGLKIKGGGPSGSSCGHSPFIPLPSSWNVLRAVVWSSKCSLPPLPEEATLLCGDRGAWSDGRHWGPLARKSSWDIHPCPRGWFGTFMGGVRETDRFKGLWCAWPERTGKKK